MTIMPKPSINLEAPFILNPDGDTNGDVLAWGIDALVNITHSASFNRGWWHDPITGESLIPGGLAWDGSIPRSTEAEVIAAWFPYVIGTKIALIHSETSEAVEAFRVDAMDDKIPFAGVTAEMADVMIRVGDLMGCLAYAAQNGIIVDLGPEAYRLSAAILTKIPFNGTRPDHDFKGRKKKF